MRRLLTALLSVLLLAASAADATSQAAPDRASVSAPATLCALFVGNSLTYVNDLPGTLQRFAAATPLHAVLTVYTVMAGGATLADHWGRGEALRVLREGRPDVLVLQGQSVEPLMAPESFAQHAALFKAEADKVHAVTVLFSTWARPPGDGFYREAVSGHSPAIMQARLNVAYASLAAHLGATLAPVGPAFVRARSEAPQVALLDGTQHPSQAGTYLAAAVLFRVLFHASPVGSTYFAGLPPAYAASLQHIAAAVPVVEPSPTSPASPTR
jgi:hypothetical protein